MYMHEVPVPVHNYTHLAPKLICHEILLSNIVACGLFQFGHTPLHSACIAGGPQVVQMLLDGGADVNAQTKVFLNLYHVYCTLSST